MGNARYMGGDQHLQALAKLIDENARRHRRHEVFRDFCEMAALSFSNAVDLLQREAREARYMEIVNRYEPDEKQRFPAMLHHLVESLQGGMYDALGALFMSLELSDHWKGQFFTPYELCRMMAMMTLGDPTEQIKRDGFITFNEPACGAGAMMIACADVLQRAGINYQQHMHVTAVDIDPTAVHMAYIQLTLLHVPAVVIHGNALSLETWGHWVTPAHVLGLWDVKINRRDQERRAHELVKVPVSSIEEPEPASIEQLGVGIVAARIEAEQLSLFG